MSQTALESIKLHEGFKRLPYIDPLYKKSIPKHELEIIEKHWDKLNITVGYGRCLQTNPLKNIEIDNLLKTDLQTIIYQLNSTFDFFKKLPDNVTDVMIEMSYQLGIHGFLEFTKTINYISNGEYEKASIEMLDSKWAKQTPKRAKTLSNKMKGEY